ILPVGQLLIQSQVGCTGVEESTQAITHRKGSQMRSIALRAQKGWQKHCGERVGQRGAVGFAGALIGDKEPGTVLHQRSAQSTTKLVAVVGGPRRNYSFHSIQEEIVGIQIGIPQELINIAM